MAIHGGIFYILSCIEYYKYKTSGSHIVISDLLMTKNLRDVGKFASLKITYPLILNFIILVVYILLTYKNNLTLDFSLKKRIRSFGYAFRGLRDLFIYEHNAWIHLTAAVCAVALGFKYKISSIEWIALCGVIGFVFAMEIINSAIEKLADVVSPQKNEKIRSMEIYRIKSEL